MKQYLLNSTLNILDFANSPISIYTAPNGDYIEYRDGVLFVSMQIEWRYKFLGEVGWYILNKKNNSEWACGDGAAPQVKIAPEYIVNSSLFAIISTEILDNDENVG